MWVSRSFPHGVMSIFKRKVVTLPHSSGSLSIFIASHAIVAANWLLLFRSLARNKVVLLKLLLTFCCCTHGSHVHTKPQSNSLCTCMWLKKTLTLIPYNGNCPQKKSSWILRIWKHLWMFSCTFYLNWNFYIWDCLNRKSFLANYGKEGNSRNFSSTDDSRYMVIK